MANYGRGWDDGYGSQSPEAVAAYDERCAAEEAKLAARRPSPRMSAQHKFAATLRKVADRFEGRELSNKEMVDTANQMIGAGTTIKEKFDK